MVKIIFPDNTEIIAQYDGWDYITDTKPNFPEDMTTVIVTGRPDGEFYYENAALVECASTNGKYVFSFIEMSPQEIKQREIEETIQMLTDCLLEMSETVYA